MLLARAQKVAGGIVGRVATEAGDDLFSRILPLAAPIDQEFKGQRRIDRLYVSRKTFCCFRNLFALARRDHPVQPVKTRNSLKISPSLAGRS